LPFLREYHNKKASYKHAYLPEQIRHVKVCDLLVMKARATPETIAKKFGGCGISLQRASGTCDCDRVSE
jgi:hypothetical protein